MRLHLKLIWGTLNYFPFLRLHQCPSRLVTVPLGSLWISIKQIKAPDIIDWEQEIALQAVQGNRASFHSEGEFTWFFSSCDENLGYILELLRG